MSDCTDWRLNEMRRLEDDNLKNLKEIVSLKEQLADKQKTFSTLAKDWELCSNENTKLIDENDALKAENERLKFRAHRDAASDNDYGLQNKEMKHEILALKEQLAEAQSKLSPDFFSHEATLKAENLDLKGKLTAAEAFIQRQVKAGVWMAGEGLEEDTYVLPYKEAFKEGWTQGQAEMLREAREKGFTALITVEFCNPEPIEVIKLSDLEVIAKESK